MPLPHCKDDYVRHPSLAKNKDKYGEAGEQQMPLQRKWYTMKHGGRRVGGWWPSGEQQGLLVAYLSGEV